MPEPLFADPPLSTPAKDRTGKLHCGPCNSLVKARPSALQEHIDTAKHASNVSTLQRAARLPAVVQQTVVSSAQRKSPAHKDLITRIVVNVTRNAIPLYGVDRIFNADLLALLEQAPKPLPPGDQLRREYLPRAVSNLRLDVRAFAMPWRRFIVLMEDESTERRSSSLGCTIVIASTPAGYAVLEVLLLDDSASGALLAGEFTKVLAAYSMSWSDIIGVAGDNVAYNGTAVRQIHTMGASHVTRIRCGSHTMSLMCRGFIEVFTEVTSVIGGVRVYVLRGHTRERRHLFNDAVCAGAANAFNVVDTRWGETLECIVFVVRNSIVVKLYTYVGAEVKRRTPRTAVRGNLAAAAAPVPLVDHDDDDERDDVDSSGVPASLLQLETAFRLGTEFIRASFGIIDHYLRPLVALLARSQGAHTEASFGWDDVQTARSLRDSINPLRTTTKASDFKALVDARDPTLLVGLGSAALTRVFVCTTSAAKRFFEKWENNMFDAALTIAERHALFVCSSAVALAARAAPLPLFSAVLPATPTVAQLGITLTSTVEAQWATYRCHVLEWVRQRTANPAFRVPLPHVYWREQLHALPDLAGAALRALATPFSTAFAECQFSTMRRIQTDQRLNMGDEYFHNAMFIACNRHLPSVSDGEAPLASY
jgi:hypothetical protein